MKKIITQAILTKDMFCYDMKSLGERKLISKRVSHNFTETLLAMLICLLCTITCQWTVITRKGYYFDASMVGKSKNK